MAMGVTVTKVDERQNQAALASWEGEGGTGGPAAPPYGQRATGRPALPPGYEAQPAWGFQDRTGRFSYQFNRVYGPPDPLDRRGPTRRLDEDLSFWEVTWAIDGGLDTERVVGRWVTYAEARALRGHGLTFARFASLPQMRPELDALLHVSEIGREPRAAPPLPWAPLSTGLRTTTESG
jgi:hypothetical protein